MIILDANVWVRALVDSGPLGDACRKEMVGDREWTAPAHTPLEVLRTLRRFETAGWITSEQASAHARAVPEAAVRYIDCAPWALESAWRLRHNISLYDAPYAAAALRIRCPLVTTDQRLARAASALGVVVRVPEA